MESTNLSPVENEVDDSINLVETLYQYLRHWKWILGSFALALVLAVVMIVVTPKEFQPSMSILLNEEKSGRAVGPSEYMDLSMLGFMGTSNIENEIVVLKSPDLMDKVVEELGLNIRYTQKKFFRETEIYKDSPYLVTLASPEKAYIGVCELEIVKNGGEYKITGEYEVMGETEKLKAVESELPTTLNLNESTSLQIALSNVSPVEGETVYVTIKSIAATTRELLTKLSVVTAAKNASVLNLAVMVNNRQKGAELLYELLEQYNELNLQVNNQMANNSAMFINDRLKEIALELSDAEEEVVEYKQQHRIADISAEAQLFVSQTSENEQKLMEIETQLKVLELIQRFIADPSNHTKTIPNMGVADVGVAKIISDYNNKLLASDQLLKGTGEKNPARVRVFEELDNMRGGIENSLANVRETYTVSRNELRQRANVTQSRISSVPKQERGLIEKVRQQKIKEDLFLFLMQKREETNLTIAASAEKARIIAAPRLNILPVSPKSKIILLAFAILGILVPVVVIYVRELLRTQISSRDEFERFSKVPIIGEVGRNESDQAVIDESQQGALVEMFRTLRNNIRFAVPKKKGLTLVMTSTVANEGKSFVSMNLALSFAFTGKKVLLIGGDIRNPQIRENLNNNPYLKSQGLSDFLIDTGSDWQKYLATPFPEVPHFEVMVAGTIPPNPNELLMSPRLGEMLLGMKEVYDYIIIDSVPVGLVSDTYLIGEYTDLTLYVVRENKTPKTAINFINMQKEQGKLPNLYVILNDTILRGSYKYGYGKAYGYENKK